MKQYLFLLLSLSLLFLNCKSENKAESKTEDVVEVTNSITEIDNNKKPENDDRLKGKTLEHLLNNALFNSLNYSSTGIHVNPEAKVNYSLGHFNSNSQTIDYLVFLKKQNNVKIVLDILKLQDEKLLSIEGNRLNTFFCFKDGKQDEEIIAIAKYEEEEEFFLKIYKAWRADRKTEKIIEIPVQGIKVENMDYGI